MIRLEELLPDKEPEQEDLFPQRPQQPYELPFGDLPYIPKEQEKQLKYGVQ